MDKSTSPNDCPVLLKSFWVTVTAQRIVGVAAAPVWPPDFRPIVANRGGGKNAASPSVSLWDVCIKPSRFSSGRG